jgi:hypothetical protein
MHRIHPNIIILHTNKRCSYGNLEWITVGKRRLSSAHAPGVPSESQVIALAGQRLTGLMAIFAAIYRIYFEFLKTN